MIVLPWNINAVWHDQNGTNLSDVLVACWGFSVVVSFAAWSWSVSKKLHCDISLIKRIMILMIITMSNLHMVLIFRFRLEHNKYRLWLKYCIVSIWYTLNVLRKTNSRNGEDNIFSQLCVAWREVTALKDPSANSWLQLLGDSNDHSEVAERLKREVGTDLPPVKMICAPTKRRKYSSQKICRYWHTFVHEQLSYNYISQHLPGP